jgi:inner membrane protein
MFIAHIPAGYLASSLIVQKQTNKCRLLAFGIGCSVLPDLDLLWFYLVDNRQTGHHAYIFHWPLFWCALAMGAWLFSWHTKKAWMHAYIVVGLVCLTLHMFLDSFAAEIYWLKPLSDMHLNVVEVPAQYNWWVWNFVFHWTFAVELAICLVAAAVFLSKRSPARRK